MVVLGGAAGVAPAGLELGGVFGDHAVLQQQTRVPVWGRAAPGAQVKVSFSGQVLSARADGQGEWRVHLDPLEPSAVGRELVATSGGESVAVRDVLVGEVWHASGQSNMAFTMADCGKTLVEIRDIVREERIDPIRVMRIAEGAADQPVDDLPGGRLSWRVDGPAVRGGHSAVAYLFARRLHEALEVPIGVIDTSWGGKPIEGFIPQEEFPKHEELAPVRTLAETGRLDELKRMTGGVVVRNQAGLPGRIFNGRVAPIAPFAMRGVIWYQGESNAGTGEDPRNYRIKMQALVEGWRREWGHPGLPFYFVQLPAYRDDVHGWVRLREEQRRSLGIPATGMAVTIDLRDEDIHPSNKLDVAERLARWALAKDYGTDTIAFSGPLFDEAAVEGDTMRVRFRHCGEGLMVARKEGLAVPVELPGGRLRHFEIADREGRWFPAAATIEGNSEVVVRSEEVAEPAAVRYACSGAPVDPNLYNRSGLPASPFCSRLDFLPWSPGTGGQ